MSYRSLSNASLKGENKNPARAEPKSEPASRAALRSTRLVYEIKKLGIAICYTSEKHEQLGVYATRDFKAGECVVAEEPSIALPKRTDADEAYLAVKMLQQDPEFVQLLFPRTMQGFQPPKPIPPQEDHLQLIKKMLPKRNEDDILHAYYRVVYNHFQPDFGYSGGVYAILSLFNHSCCPPAMFCPIPKKTGLKITATQPIRCGEEITIPYSLIYLSTAQQRQQKLLFPCNCLLCTSNTTSGMPKVDHSKEFLASLWAAAPQDRYLDLKAVIPELLKALKPPPPQDKLCVAVEMPKSPDEVCIDILHPSPLLTGRAQGGITTRRGKWDDTTQTMRFKSIATAESVTSKILTKSPIIEHYRSRYEWPQPWRILHPDLYRAFTQPEEDRRDCKQ